MEELFLEKSIVKQSTVPVDLNTGANSGARVDMSKSFRVTFVIALAAGTSTTGHVVSFQQHDAASAGNSANLSVGNPYYHKVGAATTFTKVVPGAAAASFDVHSVVADSASVLVFEVLAEDLTDPNRWVSCNVSDVGGAQLGSVLAICHNLKNDPGYDTAV